MSTPSPPQTLDTNTTSTGEPPSGAYGPSSFAGTYEPIGERQFMSMFTTDTSAARVHENKYQVRKLKLCEIIIAAIIIKTKILCCNNVGLGFQLETKDSHSFLCKLSLASFKQARFFPKLQK